ncbi:MAG TPA: integration host factor subunit alpha [Thermosulfurimonas dismutans]|uniref:Integration host factor subunit alpha n=1 Tax=Thermosulfurimonas dismutans TaxID=999894 RepID=A0A7C3GT25_9BACT|nr:HU family DNA-binding protein [Thermosulfurimonas sp.]HFC97063.1 integration host factor subunit alpha [Thermosulfurimonas dismutans]
MKGRKTVTKRDLARRLHERFGFSERSMYRFVDVLLEEIKIALERGEEVKIHHFGVFRVHRRKPRRGVNPRTGESIIIPGARKVLFRPAPTLKALLHAQE